MFFNIWQRYHVMKDHSKSQKCILNVLEFGLLHWLDIADCDTTLSFSTFVFSEFFVLISVVSVLSLFCCLLLLQWLELLSNSDVELGGFHRYSWLVGLSVVSYRFSRKTGLRIFLIFCMNFPYYKDKKLAWAFFREKSSSLIIHENVFWPFLARFRDFWMIKNFPGKTLRHVSYPYSRERSCKKSEKSLGRFSRKIVN